MCSQEEFSALLKNVTNPDNTIRAQAEKTLQDAKQNPNWLVPALLEFARASQDPVVAHISVVMLRRYVSRTSDGLFDKLDAATQNQVIVAAVDTWKGTSSLWGWGLHDLDLPRE